MSESGEGSPEVSAGSALKMISLAEFMRDVYGSCVFLSSV